MSIWAYEDQAFMYKGINGINIFFGEWEYQKFSNDSLIRLLTEEDSKLKYYTTINVRENGYWIDYVPDPFND